MILIADSGSTKTDWCVVEDGQLIQQIFTKGTNPFFQSEEEISNEIATALLPQLKTNALDAVYFYGAGCGFPDKIAMVHRAITKHLQVKGEVEVNTDMLAAARGLCQHQAGIACIMGTGSNSCYYDGKQIVTNVSPLGFILGDEGSGAVLGKLLVGDILKNQMTPELKEKFLAQNLDEPCIRALVLGSFKAFLKRNVMQYENYHKSKVHFIGSVAFYYKTILAEAAQEMGIQLGTIIKSPMEGLIEYHK